MADLDGDGRDDLLIAGTDRFGVVTTGRRGRKFESLAGYDTNRRDAILGDLMAGDVNGDGRQDLIVSDIGENALELLDYDGKANLRRALAFRIFVYLLPLFLAVNTCGLLINELFFLFFLQGITSLVHLVPIPFVQAHYRGIGLNVTKLIAAIIVMMWNFWVNRLVTFRNVKWQKNIPPEVAAKPEMIDSAL